ncbi:RNA polymerase sigma factor [Caldisericum exile]|uniref:RNA polymerase ECF-type sigma factor n=1 Tax=Caldisericum exile (strain DSM 21853 / NBRC 104410 / AZM16c01) TaxID=511051 RepID=A0A7U6GFB1_CALEA|nr:RNA polymerase sigma factor [Caldisericum exile]BAL81299.1 RNA polymerase ECF-type sigma factor [Caldisericum exile AZM16c01]
MDERKVIERLKSGDEIVFKEFFEFYYDRIFNYAYRRIKMKEIAEDITSETFYKFIKSLPNFELKEGYHIDTWLYAIERNLIRDWFRRNLHKDTLDLEEKFDRAYEPLLRDPYESFANEFISKTIIEALEKLPEQYKEIIKMRFYENKGIKEIADILGKTEVATKVLQFRALKRLKEIIEEMING